MSWFFLAMIAPALWSILNHVDKYLIKTYAHHTGVGGLAVYSSAFALVALPVVGWLSPTSLLAAGEYVPALIATGFIGALAILLYLYALEEEDASRIVPFWFLVPVFGYALGTLMLGERLVETQLWGGVITLFGALVLSIEFEGSMRIKHKAAGLMLGSSFLFALASVLFKDATIHDSFWSSLFWNQAGMAMFGVLLFAVVPTFRKDFLAVLFHKSKILLTCNILGELAQIVAAAASYYVSLLAPIALVLVVEYTFQPLFVFLQGLLFTTLVPAFVTEKIDRHHNIQKILSLIIMGAGVWLVLL